MRGHMLRKMVFTSFLVCVSASFQDVAFSTPSSVVECDVVQVLSIEDKLIKNAFETFKEVIENKDGHIQRISCRYKLYKNETIQTNRKIYYTDYHRRPDFRVQAESVSQYQPDSIVEIVYSTRNKHVSFIHKDGKEKHCFSKKQISLPAEFTA